MSSLGPPLSAGSTSIRLCLQWGQLLLCLEEKHAVVVCTGLANDTVLPTFENVARHLPPRCDDT